jgi:hypothetical protein
MRRTKKMSAAQRERRRTAYARWLRERLQQDGHPADPAVVRLFADLQRWDRSKRTRLVQQVERQAWENLVRYLLTLERV